MAIIGSRGRDVLDEGRRDGLAGAAPDGEGVEDDDFVLLDGGLELSHAVGGGGGQRGSWGGGDGRGVGAYLWTLWTPMILVVDEKGRKVWMRGVFSRVLGMARENMER